MNSAVQLEPNSDRFAVEDFSTQSPGDGDGRHLDKPVLRVFTNEKNRSFKREIAFRIKCRRFEDCDVSKSYSYNHRNR